MLTTVDTSLVLYAKILITMNDIFYKYTSQKYSLVSLLFSGVSAQNVPNYFKFTNLNAIVINMKVN